jgi:putative DNA primase/helicase
MSYEGVLSRFRRLRACTKRANNWDACCPAHDDRSPSLRLWIGKEGELCARCYAGQGCTWRDIVEASGTNPSDWFPVDSQQRVGQGRGQSHRRGRKGANVAREIEATYDYFSEDGELVLQVVRYKRDEQGKKHFAQRRPDGKGGWAWDTEGLSEKPLYRLLDLIERPDEPVIVVEGEKDVESVMRLGLLSTCNPGGAGKWSIEHGRTLRGRRVAILPDNDRPGQIHAMLVAGSLMYWGAASIRIVHLGGPEGGDVTDWLADAVRGASDKAKRQALLAHIRGTPEWAMLVPTQAVPRAA